ncbi:lanthionine synthetase C family protein [Streptomyces virginiae]|uniref:lanthionine synthetase C family protein n=1 Tax=Streptomyces virginiae TaxID=1961 RepID=UPI002259E40F|nr:lanthionine synthetase C family protein [Streptomyces virginiae]MCX5176139.1 lanthionine synthetase C family protein [Streptomyces virginiae]
MTTLAAKTSATGGSASTHSHPEVQRILGGIADTLLRTYDDQRADRLWPADYMVFATNPLSVAYGACGTALFLRSRTSAQGSAPALPTEVTSWMLGQPLGTDTYPPGLYLGLAGVAWAFHDLGWDDRGEAAMALLYESPLLYDEPSMFLGVAGWGLASLRFHARTGRQLYLDRAVQAGEELLRTARKEGDTCYWQSPHDGRVHYGYGYGASGMALFLLHLGLVTGDARFRSCAVRALEFDLAHATESSLGLQWQRFQDDIVMYPYWIQGAAGVGSVLVRFHQLLGIDRYGDLARRVADDTFVKYAYNPGLFEGLAGIGEFMLDMYRCSGDQDYWNKACDIAETILWFRVEDDDGTAFPGRWLNRITHDYATGSAGIGMFLSRLVEPRERDFVDL